jgi:hypothetical protein
MRLSDFHILSYEPSCVKQLQLVILVCHVVTRLDPCLVISQPSIGCKFLHDVFELLLTLSSYHCKRKNYTYHVRY